ncbi:MAG: chemotaxis-specific protein-glutamate methyltransferase CheB [bacterium]
MKKVLIVDDSFTAREYLKYILHSTGDFQVVGMAEDGEDAIQKVQLTHPDVVIMDFYMPKMNGHEATRRIMESYPVPIVAVSATWFPELVREAFLAMEAGAVAAIGKPRGTSSNQSDGTVDKFLQTVKLMSEIKVVRRLPKYHRGEENSTKTNKVDFPASGGIVKSRSLNSEIDIVAIGASTGGPPVIETILSNLPEQFMSPILIVQHISDGFLDGMVEWLSKNTHFPVLIPGNGDQILPGHAYYAPCGVHMGVTRKGKIILSKDPPEKSLRPAVSYLFRSVAESFGKKAIGVLLTGMGADGALELKMMKDNGAITIAQDRTSSVVHGMPGEAIKLGGVDYVLAPRDIATLLVRIVNGN